MSLPYIQANTNGHLHPASEPSIAPLNRGFLYGDAIYEVWRTYGGAIFAWEEHYARLERSAAAVHLTLPWSRGDILAEIKRTGAAYRAATAYGGELYLRLQVTRGGGSIGLDVALADRADFVILVQPCPACAPEVGHRGLRLAVATQLRRNPIESLSPAWKTGNYLNNILGLREARARGADDVLMLNLRGEATEAATSNIAFVRGGTVFTPGLAAGILGGITRALVIERLAPSAGVPVVEAALAPADFARMQECFLMATTKGITPVAAIDDTQFRVGEDTVTTRLQAALAEYAREVVATRPELKV